MFTEPDAHLARLEIEPGNQHPVREAPRDMVGSKRPYTDGRSEFSHVNSTSNAKTGIDPNSALSNRGDSFLVDSSGNEGAPKQSPEDLSKRPKTSPVPETSLRNAMLTGNGSKQNSKVATRVDNKLSVSTGMHVREEARPKPVPSSDPKHEPTKPASLLEGSVQSPPVSAATTVSTYQTALNTPLMMRVRDGRMRPTLAPAGSPSAADRDQAQKLYDSVEDGQKAELTATWLGNPDRAGVRKAYLDLFDWSGMDILAAMRSLCSKMALKGETQQVDRVLDAFSSRWCECNPNHGFKATADIEQKMTRNQFIRNTMPTIERVVADAAPDAFEGIVSNKLHRPRSTDNSGSQPGRASTPYGERDDNETNIASNLLNTPQDNISKATAAANIPNINGGDISAASSIQLVNVPFRGTKKAWENQIESALKEFYNSIQKRRLPLRGAQAEPEEQQPSNNFLTLTSNVLRRTPSTLSRATTSDLFTRGRPTDHRLSTARWASKPRSRPRMYPPSTMTSSRTSLDDQSVWSPTASSTWSKASLGKTLTSMSVDSLGSEYPRGDYQQSIGFANALSHAIIREDSASCIFGTEDSTRAESLLEADTWSTMGEGGELET
ncbi:guanine nucleotide exchange factor [Coccidioides immitis RMSCC 3703]|uniref:Guanine nucleotide exchange factor n=1 Tax=Coccidioides immitis RMSCC 3703 TaxID=454286 RepID=A0A0J8R7V1_COCIT|nr:guanine nucleotide exchange factor [Coccidioides immitis RMSCC 3703]